MTGAIWFALTVLVNALAFGVGLLVGKWRRVATGFFAFAVLILLAKGVLNWRPDWEFALFPFPDYLFIQSWLGFPLGLLAMGLGVRLLHRFRDRRALAVLAAFIFCLSLWSERWMLMTSGHESDRDAGENHHCIQSTRWSCGPSACVSLLSYHGIHTTEGEMIALCRTQAASGTSIFRICRGLRLKLDEKIFDIRIVDGDPEALREIGQPAIVTKNMMHVVTVKISGDEVTLHDPSKTGPHELTFAEYSDLYSGFAVVVLPRR